MPPTIPASSLTLASLASLAVLSALTSSTLAQPTATILTTANGGASATIAPGEIVSISVTLSHNAFSVAGFHGSTFITNNAGQGQNLSTFIPVHPLLPGLQFTGGSLLDVDIGFTPPGFIGGATPPSGQNPMTVWTYDIAGLTPGVYDINWIPDGAALDIRLYTSISSFTSVNAQSTYIGATITVVPSPGGLALALACPLVAARRRRRL